MEATDLTLECAGRINGKIVNVRGTGHGIVSRGRFVDESFSEVMVPISDKNIRSFVNARFRSDDGWVPVRVTGLYSSLGPDGEWGCSSRVVESQRTQVRTSFIEDLRTTDSTLSLKYMTVVKGIDVPVISRDDLLAQAS